MNGQKLMFRLMTMGISSRIPRVKMNAIANCKLPVYRDPNIVSSRLVLVWSLCIVVVFVFDFVFVFVVVVVIVIVVVIVEKTRK